MPLLARFQERQVYMILFNIPKKHILEELDHLKSLIKKFGKLNTSKNFPRQNILYYNLKLSFSFRALELQHLIQNFKKPTRSSPNPFFSKKSSTKTFLPKFPFFLNIRALMSKFLNMLWQLQFCTEMMSQLICQIHQRLHLCCSHIFSKVYTLIYLDWT